MRSLHLKAENKGVARMATPCEKSSARDNVAVNQSGVESTQQRFIQLRELTSTFNQHPSLLEILHLPIFSGASFV